VSERAILQAVIDYFKDHEKREYAFEKCAAEIARLMDSNVTDYELTRPWRDLPPKSWSKKLVVKPTRKRI
jgi:hypothetical protein